MNSVGLKKRMTLGNVRVQEEGDCMLMYLKEPGGSSTSYCILALAEAKKAK